MEKSPDLKQLERCRFLRAFAAVRVNDNDFEFNGKLFSTLSAVAKAITGSHVNGFLFFKLKGQKEVSK